MNLRKVFALAVVAALTIVGCDRDATEAECDDMVTHVFEVELKGLDKAAAELSRPALEDMKGTVVKECREYGKHKEVTCVLAATTKEAIDKCSH